MIRGLSSQSHKFISLFIKLGILVGASCFIYQKLAHNENFIFYDFLDFLSKNDPFSAISVVFLVFLTIFNWFFEILKWQNITFCVKTISLFESGKQCLASHTVSIFTPNKIGEYGAKAIFYSPSLRKQVLLLNLLANMAQMGITFIFGIIGLTYFISRYNVDNSYYKLFYFPAFLVLIVPFLFYAIKQSEYEFKRFSLKRINDFIVAMPLKIQFKTVLFSIIRYLIFSFQFYYLLSLFGVNMDYMNAMIIITTMYLLSSIIPVISVFEVAIKGSIALFLFNFVHVNEIIILYVTTIMWLLNFVLPSIFGSIFVMNFKHHKTISSTLSPNYNCP